AAGGHDVGDMVAEPRPDLVQHRLASLILGGIVQERGDRLVLVAAVLDHERADAEQVTDIRDAAALADLRAVGRGGELKGMFKSLAELDPPGPAVEVLFHNSHPNGAPDALYDGWRIRQKPARAVGAAAWCDRRAPRPRPPIYPRATPGELTQA